MSIEDDHSCADSQYNLISLSVNGFIEAFIG